MRFIVSIGKAFEYLLDFQVLEIPSRVKLSHEMDVENLGIPQLRSEALKSAVKVIMPFRGPSNLISMCRFLKSLYKMQHYSKISRS